MAIKVIVNYPENMEELNDKASEVLASILVKKLQPNELIQFMEILKSDEYNITM